MSNRTRPPHLVTYGAEDARDDGYLSVAEAEHDAAENGWGDGYSFNTDEDEQ